MSGVAGQYTVLTTSLISCRVLSLQYEEYRGYDIVDQS